MCRRNDKKEGCRKLEDLKGKPEDYSPEQISKCHDDVKEHPCRQQNCVRQPREDDG